MNLTGGDWGLFAMSAGMFIVFISFLIWGLKSGQFKNVEEAKYKMLEDVEKDGDKEEKEQEKDDFTGEGGGLR